MTKLAEIRTRIGNITTLQAEEEGEAKRYRVNLIPLDEETEDGRIFEELEWREPPLPLMATKETSVGHMGAVFVGNLRDFKKEEFEGTDWVTAEVDWDDEDETALDFKRLVDQGKLTAISADVAILDYDLDIEFDEDGFIENMRLVVHLGKVLGATIVPMPAFEKAGFAASADEDHVRPPAEWFENPELDRLTPLRVDGDRVYGHLAPWNECHVGIPNACVTAPHNESNYQLFLAAEIETDDGEKVPVGQITLAGGHADRGLNARKAAAHYDDTRAAIADIAVGEDEHGIWFSGAIRPSATDMDRRMLSASKLSGDWRPFKGDLELVAVLCVNSPGFPIARSLVAAGKQEALLMTGVVPDHEQQLAGHVEKLESLVERIEYREMVAEAKALTAGA